MNKGQVDTIQEGLQAKSHTLGIVKGTVYLRTRVPLRGMERKTAWSVADVWRVLKLFTSMEVKYEKAALKGQLCAAL